MGKRQVDEVGELGAFLLGDADDAVAVLDQAAAGGGAAGDEFLDLAVAVLGLQRGADADEREVHADFKALELLGTHVVRVRVIDLGERFR